MNKHFIRVFILFFTVSSFVMNVNSQFVDVSSDLLLPTDHTGGFLGAGVSFADFNNDNIDDLTFGHHAGQIRFYQGDGVWFEEIQLNIVNDLNETKSVLWADIDNDGDQDFFITNRNASNKLWLNDGGMQFTDVTSSCGISTSIITKSYGASFGDYDNDGYIDLYICNFHSSIIDIENELYHNNGNGTFTEVTAIAGVGNGFQQSFQSTWIDIDKDGFLDLHVINDRPNQQNSFYHNNGDGTFTDVASDWGVNISVWAMSSTFGDYDRDGDLDLYVTNSLDGNVLLSNNMNEGGGFIDVTDIEAVQVNQICWGACFIDHENDSWLDLYVASGMNTFTDYPAVFDQYGVQPNAFYSSSGDSSMLYISTETPQAEQYSFAIAKGDFNNDGFPDLVSHQIGEYASVISSTPNENHFLKVMPQGTSVNRDAIGAEVMVYHSEGLNTGVNTVNVDVVFCGDKYLSQNSRHLHFGLGTSSQIDSVVVQWPGAGVESFHGLSIDTSIVLIEGSSLDGGTNDECTDPWNFCGVGTTWDEVAETCISIFTEDVCPSDLNNDGYINVPDLLQLLINFDTICTE